ncbi:MAG TPA: hypothetical protein VM533_04430 [Fimbriiglobus sp.]|nr:hypothetical protein [Fimbriiglobus sp.]
MLPTIPTWIDIPEVYRSILLGIREELEAKGCQVGLQMASPSWGERQGYRTTKRLSFNRLGNCLRVYPSRWVAARASPVTILNSTLPGVLERAGPHQ